MAKAFPKRNRAGRIVHWQRLKVYPCELSQRMLLRFWSDIFQWTVRALNSLPLGFATSERTPMQLRHQRL